MVKNVEDFIEEYVSIEYYSDFKEYCHHPFQFIVEDLEGKYSLGSIVVNESISDAYQLFHKHIGHTKRMYMSIDCPAVKGFIDTDFIIIQYMENGNELGIIVLPYDNKTGKMLDRITDGKVIDMLMEQYLVVFPQNQSRLKEKMNFKDIDEFVSKHVKVKYLADEKTYGYCPYHMFVEHKDGRTELRSIYLGDDIEKHYDIANEYGMDGAKRIYFTLEFSPILDIEHNFIFVHNIENVKREFEVFAIPYNKKTGEVYSRITKGEAVESLKKQFADYCISKSQGELDRLTKIITGNSEE